jgi:hypothetical protein
MTTPHPRVVELVQIGDLPRGVRLDRLQRLLRRQNYLHFRLRNGLIDPGQLRQPSRGVFFFTEEEIFPCLDPSQGAELVVGITSLRIAISADARELENEYFGIWRNSLVPLRPEHAGKGVISITRWRERYEGRAFRSTEQFLAFMIMAFVGDAHSDDLTHAWCTGCVFDYNPDNESIVSSMKTATLCAKCRQSLRLIQPQLEEAFLKILREVERPPMRAVLSYLQGNGLASVFLFSVILALSVGLLQTLLPNVRYIALATSLLCAAIFLGVVWYFRRFPSGDLK